MTKNISIIDYEVGNILSVKRSVEILGFNALLTNEKSGKIGLEILNNFILS